MYQANTLFIVLIVICSNTSALHFSKKATIEKVSIGNVNLIRNGNFEEIDHSMLPGGIGEFDRLSGGWYNTKSYIEAGYGKMFLSSWEDNNVVVHLDIRGNVYQDMTLSQDSDCNIQFRYGGYYDSQKGDTTTLKVFFNGSEVFNNVSSDQAIHSANIDVNGLEGENRLEFEGISFNWQKGITIDDVVFTCDVAERIDLEEDDFDKSKEETEETSEETEETSEEVIETSIEEVIEENPNGEDDTVEEC